LCCEEVDLLTGRMSQQAQETLNHWRNCLCARNVSADTISCGVASQFHSWTLCMHRWQLSL